VFGLPCGCVSRASEENREKKKKMNAKRSLTPKWSAADRARHKAIRQDSQNCPTQEQFHANGTHEGPIKSGAYFKVHILISELKKVRQAARLTLAAISKRTGIDQASLSRLENGRQANPTVDTLWRYAHALGRELVLTHCHNTFKEAARNGKQAKAKRC
jgi:hypothetical protein